MKSARITPKSAPHQIITERLVLRKPRPDVDTLQAFAAVQADRERLSRWLPWVPRIQSEADERAFLQRAVQWWDQAEQFHWLIFTRDTYTYLGMVGGHDLQWSSAVAEIGYWLTSDAVGQGYMSEAVRAVEDCLFQMGFFRIEIQCAARNERSAAVARRLGYAQEGRLRSNRAHQGVRDDTLVFSRLASDT